MQAIISFKTFAGSQAAFAASFSFGGEAQAAWRGSAPDPGDAERRELLRVGPAPGLGAGGGL